MDKGSDGISANDNAHDSSSSALHADDERRDSGQGQGSSAPGTPWFLSAPASFDLNSDDERKPGCNKEKKTRNVSQKSRHSSYAKKTLKRFLYEQHQKLKHTEFYKQNPKVLQQQADEYTGLVHMGRLSALDVDMVAGRLLRAPFDDMYVQAVADYRHKHRLVASASSKASGKSSTNGAKRN